MAEVKSSDDLFPNEIIISEMVYFCSLEQLPKEAAREQYELDYPGSG